VLLLNLIIFIIIFYHTATTNAKIFLAASHVFNTVDALQMKNTSNSHLLVS